MLDGPRRDHRIDAPCTGTRSVGHPLDRTADPHPRARGDTEPARVLRDHAAGRVAAGRPVPEGLYRRLVLAEAPESRPGRRQVP
ncbi:hypothetical protein ACFW2E_34120, partial [Streptomyces sp. NPDC058964]